LVLVQAADRFAEPVVPVDSAIAGEWIVDAGRPALLLEGRQDALLVA
jgi:hypothetical protein